MSTPRLLLAAATILAALALPAAAASAAQLTNADGTLTYAGTDADNDVTFTRTAPNEVQVVRDTVDDTDPITASGCTQNTAGADYTCSGVTRIVANGSGGNDVLNGAPVTDIPMTIDGGAGYDALDGGDAADTIGVGPGGATIFGNGGDDKLTGGEERDVIFGDGGADTIATGAGVDDAEGGAENDTIDGGPGGDRVIGDEGEDVLNGGDGDDVMLGADGNDLVRGDAGDDLLVGDPGNDDLTGGSGYDTATGPVIMGSPPPIAVSIDDAAGDRHSGGTGENDNVHADIEAIDAEFPTFSPTLPSQGDTLTGNAGANSIFGGGGTDTIDGGLGNDVLGGGDDDDTIRARDAYADFVNCGGGTDTVEVDSLDTLQECENVSVAEVGNANEDRPPAIQLDGPAAGALLGTAAPTTMSATATDDRGVAQVLFLDDDRIVCADSAAPYTCSYAPRGEDVGRNTLVAIAVDTSQQTASATRTFLGDRFTPTITGRVTPGRDTRAPFRFRTTGRLTLPAAVSPAVGCLDGVVSIQVKAGGRTISTRRAGVTRACSFASTVTFATRRRFTRSGTLRFTIRFTGNTVLKRSTAVARNLRTRR